MNPLTAGRAARALESLAAALGAAGASLVLETPGHPPLRIGQCPERTRVVFHTPASLRPLARRDLLGLAEAHLRGEIDVEGDFLQALALVDLLAPDPSPLERLALELRLRLRRQQAFPGGPLADADRPPELFLPWLERWRSRSHGLYAADDDAPEAAQARKLQRAVDALGLEPGMRVFDMGCGWGSFLEYAGRLGVHVHGITRSRQQHRFVSDLIGRLELPCTVERVDFLDFRPTGPFDGAVFMGTLERVGDLRFAARFLARHLAPGARVWADFCAVRAGTQANALARQVLQDRAPHVDLARLLGALAREGFGVWELADDTLSCARTCRDQAEALEAQHEALAERFGEAELRGFRVFLRASQHFLASGQVQAYHLVAAREPAPLAWRTREAHPPTGAEHGRSGTPSAWIPSRIGAGKPQHVVVKDFVPPA